MFQQRGFVVAKIISDVELFNFFLVDRQAWTACVMIVTVVGGDEDDFNCWVIGGNLEENALRPPDNPP